MAKTKDEINLKNRANARRKLLEELRFRDIDNASDELLDTMRPSAIRTALDDVIRNSVVFKYGPIKELLNVGVKLPQSVEYLVILEEERQERMRQQQEREDELRRMYNSLPKIYRDQLADDGYETPQEVEDRIRDIRRELEVIIQDGVDVHHDIVKKSGASYRWGVGSDNPVEEQMFRILSQLNDIQVIWLLNMYENGTLFSDYINYDSQGDGKHTRYIYSAINIIESAKDVGSDGIHPQYGSVSRRSMRGLFKNMADTTAGQSTMLTSPADSKGVKDILESGYTRRRIKYDEND